MGIMTAVGDRQYTRPPVRLTVFTVYFKPLDLDLGVITELRNMWASAYPGFTQVAPRNRLGGILPSTDLFALTWPMPAAQMADTTLSRTLAFQFDQFSLTWKFDTDGESNYPGYAALADELVQRFSEFVAVVDSSSDGTVAVEGCQCFYTNTLEGIGGRAWLSSFLAVETGTASLLDDAVHFGFRLYKEDEAGNTKRTVSVQLDAGTGQLPEVDISAVATPSEDAEDLPTDTEDLARALLGAAHSLENQTFESSFSETMKKDWETES
ncbi:Uncharacterised protein [Mycobacteroides abscessus subsp. abscessus]|nr:Uncharacterised protein [Mycobacteroides abscessus subsp. abscessus]SLL33175.1 Uncharacterised protein [Mycobacteroides abscessus subsp. abscessus]